MEMTEHSSIDAPVRPYQRLQVQLANLITSISAGDRLPSEPELARQLGVSRATLRESMRSFEAQGLLRRRQGVGTFVVGHPQVIETGLEALESIETLASRNQLDVTMGHLNIRQITADATQAQKLEVEEDTPLIWVTRTILANNSPAAYLIDVLPEDVLTVEELKCGFTGSVLDFLLRRGTPALATSKAEINAVAASPEIARALEIQRGDVLLQFDACLLTTSGRVIDYSLSYFVPGYFRFHVVRKVGEVN